jgi:hypothetical protein
MRWKDPRVGEGPSGGELHSCGDPALLPPGNGGDPAPIRPVGDSCGLLLLPPADTAGILLGCWKALRGLPPTMAARYGSRPEGDGGREWDSTRLAPVTMQQSGSKDLAMQAVIV